MPRKKKTDVKKIQQKVDEMEQSYPVSVSDWINIIQDKISRGFHLELYVFIAVITAIIGVPSIIEYTGWDELGIPGLKSIALVGIILAFYICYIIVSRKNRRVNEPYKKLLNEIIQGKITDTKEILKKFNEINPDKIE